MDSLKLRVDPLRPALMSGPEAGMRFLVRVQAPLPPPSRERSPFHLALVLDRSGSMSGRPLREAVNCAKEIVRRLVPKDKLAVVVYDDEAQVLVPCRPADDPDRVCHILDGIHSGGSTDLHQGWSKGVGQLRDASAPGVLSQVLLLSDGNANAGLVDPLELGKESAAARAAGVGTSTYGLGEHFDERLMGGMAAKGQGRAYFGQTASDLLPLFLEEFDLMSDLFAKELVLRLQPSPGVRLRVINPYELFGADGWILPSVPYAGEAWAVIQVTADETALARLDRKGNVPLFRAGLEWKRQDGSPEILKKVPVALPLRTAEEFATLKDDLLVALRIRDLQVAELQNCIHGAAQVGDWTEVNRLLDELKLLVGDDPILQELLEPLERLVRQQDRTTSKEAYYRSLSQSSCAMESMDLDVDLDPGEGMSRSYFRGKAGSRRPQNAPGGTGSDRSSRLRKPGEGTVPPATPGPETTTKP
jgi:Ca-activated chloride channel family protein